MSTSKPDTGNPTLQDDIGTGRIDPVDEQIVELVARRFTHEEVAERLNISTKTVQRRMKEPELRDLMLTRRRAILAETAGQLVELAPDALGALAELLTSKQPNVQLKAVQMILSLGRRFHFEDRYESSLDERIERLEALLDPSIEEPGI